MNNKHDDVIEIDLLEIWNAVRRWIVVICLVGLVGAAGAFGFTKVMITPIYTAENSMLVLAKDNDLMKLADLQLGSQLTNDYKILTTSRPVLTKVIEQLELDMSYNQLKGSIQIENPKDTRILTVRVEHADPQLALDIVRSVVYEASVFISESMAVPLPVLIDEGVLPTGPSSPSVMKNTLMGLLLGLMASGGLVALRVILDDTLKTEEHVDRYLGLPVLSVVPDRKDYISKGKKKKKRN